MCVRQYLIGTFIQFLLGTGTSISWVILIALNGCYNLVRAFLLHPFWSVLDRNQEYRSEYVLENLPEFDCSKSSDTMSIRIKLEMFYIIVRLELYFFLCDPHIGCMVQLAAIHPLKRIRNPSLALLQTMLSLMEAFLNAIFSIDFYLN